MSSFTSPLIVEVLDDGRNCEIHEQFGYRIGDVNSKRRVQIAVGYVTDFGTIPRIFWIILPPHGKYGKATVVHDYLCSYRKVLTEDGFEMISRKEADDIFLEAMGVLNVPWYQKYPMYAAVRAYATVMGIK